jgi:hypothetical protein
MADKDSRQGSKIPTPATVSIQWQPDALKLGIRCMIACERVDYCKLVAAEMAAKPSTETELYGTRDVKKC